MTGTDIYLSETQRTMIIDALEYTAGCLYQHYDTARKQETRDSLYQQARDYQDLASFLRGILQRRSQGLQD